MNNPNTIIFLEMLEEVLLEKITGIKYLGKKNMYRLELWEELFSIVRERKNKSSVIKQV